MTTISEPRIAAVLFENGMALNQLFSETVDSLRAQGTQLCGVIQNEKPGVTPNGSACCGSLGLEDLSLGEEMSVTQNLGSGAEDCHLDSYALTQAAATLIKQISAPDANFDLLIINRFGQSESEGHGMLNVFAEAVMRGIPVLTAVKSEHLAAWEQWHSGIAKNLPQDQNEILSWCLADSENLSRRITQS